MSGRLVVHQPSSSEGISEATVKLQRGAVTPKQCISSQPPVVCSWGCREVSITWVHCVNSGQMEKLAVWLINVVDIKHLRVGGFAWWGGAEQGLGSIQLILSGLNPGC